MKSRLHIILTVVLCSVLLFAAQNEAAKILAAFPSPSISHQVVYRPYILELVNRGHEVVVFTTDPAFEKGTSPRNLREIDMHDIAYGSWVNFAEITITGRKSDLTNQITTSQKLIMMVFVEMLKTPEVQKILKNENFDLIIVEAFIMPTLVLSHYIKAPVIQINSFAGFFQNYDTIGAPNHITLYPNCKRQSLHDNTILGKLTELYRFLYTLRKIYQMEEEHTEYMRQHLGPDIPNTDELRKNVDMVFLNIYPIWDNNRPAPPGLIYMGGLHQNPVKELPKELKSYLDSSKNGVIYVSFGTNVKPELWPPEKIAIFVNVLSKLPYDILWKWNEDELLGRTQNIKISKWLPQSDLLRHPKVKLFIMQAGLQSTDESIAGGVPMIGVPMLGDQWYNAEMYVKLKIGHNLDMEHLTELELSNSINKILSDESYRENVKKLNITRQDEPQKPLERAVWWTEHLLRHGGAKHLRSPAALISWREYLELDLVLVLLSGLGVMYFIVYKLYKLIFSTKKTKVKKN